MLDVKNPQINVEDVMQRIQEKVRLQREQALSQPRAIAGGAQDSTLTLYQHLAEARATAQVGAGLPPMSRTRGLKRAIARVFARLFLRVAQLITRDQRQFNQAIVSALQIIADGVAPLESRLRGIVELLARESGRISSLAQDTAHLNQRIAELTASVQALSSQGRDHALENGRLRTAISLQERRLSLLLEEAKRQPGSDGRQLDVFARELAHIGDAGYLQFEDTFRGSREDIQRRVSIYLPKFRESGAGTSKFPILDLGCGRGELVEVLRNEGLTARGVDGNEAAVEKCKHLKLDVELSDIFESLRAVPDGSLGGVSALHVIEHLPFPLLLKVLDESLRVLKPGGVLVLETPNPLSILVGASSFYLDPTHRNPVHPQTLSYLCEARGFIQVETSMLHPYGAEIRVAEDSEVARRFNDYFYGPQDYAVVGRRP